jgi:hypothetical protein
MRQRKIAISLAVIGAIAAPFVFRTYKMDPVLWRVVPFTTEGKEKAAAWVADHCEGITEEPPPPRHALWRHCQSPCHADRLGLGHADGNPRHSHHARRANIRVCSIRCQAAGGEQIANLDPNWPQLLERAF